MIKSLLKQKKHGKHYHCHAGLPHEEFLLITKSRVFSNNEREPCPNTPAVIDLVKIIFGFVLFSIDSTIMKRQRGWNFRQLFLGGFVPEVLKTVEKKKGCSLCTGKQIKF